MSKLQTYVLKEVVKAHLIAFSVLLAVMILGMGVQLLQEGLDVVRMRGHFYYMAVYCAPWVLPSALMTAVIMVFGRLSADKEILAMQVEGMHLWHILYPVYILGIFTSLIGIYLHFQRAPDARFQIENKKAQALMQVVRDRILHSTGRQFHVSPYTVSYEGYENGRLKNVKILQAGRQGALSVVINARSGSLDLPPERPNMMYLVLEQCAVTQLADVELGGPGTTWASRAEFPLEVGSVPDEGEKDIKHMTWFELKDKQLELQGKLEEGQRFRNPAEKSDQLSGQIRTIGLQRRELITARNRIRNRLNALQTEMENEREGIADRRERLARLQSDVAALHEQRIQYVQLLENAMEEQDNDDERFRRISEIQKELNDVRSRIEELETTRRQLQRELERRNAAMEVKRRNVERFQAELEGLSREISKLTEERSELNSARYAATVQEDIREIKIRTQRRLTLAFAAMAFTVLGIPLGLLSKRQSTLLAFGVGFFIMLAVFYPFMVWGQIMAETGILPVAPAMWIGNGVTFLIGAVMTLALCRR